MKGLLNSPSLYQAFQQAGGFFGARAKAIADYLPIHPNMRVIDIGCGPGHILRYLPREIEYIGFDIDGSYITHAKKAFGSRGTFHSRYFDAAAANEFAPADIVMMNGVVHHIPDGELKTTLKNAYDALKNGGVLFTLDGCYSEGQSRFTKWLLNNDRGHFVRDRNGYVRALESIFESVDVIIRDDYSRVPYTFAIGVSVKR